MAHVSVPAIEALRVDPVELAHALRKVRLGCFDHQVVVVRHQPPRMATPVETAAHLAEHVEPHPAVGLVYEDRLAAVTARRDVVERVREFKT